MKKLLISVFVLVSAAGLCFSEDTVSSRIAEVTLFTNQALITRNAETKVKEGLSQILLEIEAFSLDADSVQAKVFGDGDIYSVQFREIHLKEAPQENIKNLEEKIKKLKDGRSSLSDSIKVLSKKEEFLDSLIDFSKTQIPEDIKTSFPNIEDLGKTLSFLDNNIDVINKSRQEFNLKIEQLNKDIQVLERELASLRSYTRKTKKVIEILFNSKKEQKIRIEASYLAYQAWWQPFYKVDVPVDLEEVNLGMFSKITQKTGEDWQDILLSVSNVIPLRGVGLPSAASWHLDIPRYTPMEDKERFKTGGMSMSRIQKTEPALPESRQEVAAYIVDGAAGEREADFISAERKELPLSFEYELPQKINIESQDKETILPLFAKTIKGEFFHYVVPQSNSLVFLVCKASSDKELLSGYLNVYFAGRFVGKTYLAEKKPGDDFNISLGADREVKVKREKIKDKFNETFFGKIQRQTVIRELAFKVTVDNLKSKTVKIKVIDSIPVSKTDKIEVKDLKITPKPKEEKYQDKEGVMLWEFELKPKEKKEINIEFSVTYPQDSPISGL